MKPLLLTPGPLSTHPSTRQAMSEDRGSRDPAFLAMDTRTWAGIVSLVQAEDPHGDWVCVPVQGSGTFAVEAMLGSLSSASAPLLVAENGAYGSRMSAMRQRMGRPVLRIDSGDEAPLDLLAIERALRADPRIEAVAVVHCETTTGRLNPLDELAALVQAQGRRLLVDAMSAFGALPLGPAIRTIDAIAASANKCLEGVPGVAFVLARRELLDRSAGRSPSLSLDLHEQWRRRELDGQWRFTPPTHVIAALDAALDLHRAEGAVAGRGRRYAENARVLRIGMQSLGFQLLLPEADQAPIILTFHEPADPAWDFELVYQGLVDRGFAIYPGKLTRRPSFRVGCIGQVQPADLQRFVESLDELMGELGITSGSPHQ